MLYKIDKILDRLSYVEITDEKYEVVAKKFKILFLHRICQGNPISTIKNSESCKSLFNLAKRFSHNGSSVETKNKCKHISGNAQKPSLAV